MRSRLLDEPGGPRQRQLRPGVPLDRRPLGRDEHRVVSDVQAQGGQPLRKSGPHVLSRMISRSNSAKAPKTWKISLLPAVVVSSDSFRLRKPTPLPSSSPTRSMSSRSDPAVEGLVIGTNPPCPLIERVLRAAADGGRSGTFPFVVLLQRPRARRKACDTC